MMKRSFKNRVFCPWCGKGSTFVDKPAETFISCQCQKCTNYYTIDLMTMETERSGAVPNT